MTLLQPAPVAFAEPAVVDVLDGNTTPTELAPVGGLAALPATIEKFASAVDVALFAELESFKAELDVANSIKALADGFAIATEADAADAAACMNGIHKRATELEAKRTSVTKPINSAKRAVDAQFAEPADALKYAKDVLSRKIGAFRAKLAAEQAAKLAEAAKNAKTAEEHRAVITESTAEAPKLAGTRMVTEITIAIVNAAAVPRPFCSPDAGLVKAAVEEAIRLGQPVPTIEGVTIHVSQKAQPTGRA